MRGKKGIQGATSAGAENSLGVGRPSTWQAIYDDRTRKGNTPFVLKKNNMKK